MEEQYAIFCDTESSVLSNKRDKELWDSLFRLVQILEEGSGNSQASAVTLFAWSKEPRHVTVAKEPYAWRAIIELIKNSDLVAICSGIVSRDELSILADKPTMLKISGEVTNALIHSYNSRHAITFKKSE